MNVQRQQHEKSLSQQEINAFQVMALYAQGMTTRDIQDILHQLYGVEVSPTLISEVTSKIGQDVLVWRTRPLDPVWPIISMDVANVHFIGDLISLVGLKV